MFEKIAYFFAHKIICLSSDMAKSVSKRISGKKICIIPNCSDPELFILKNEQTPIELKPLENIRETHEFVVFYTGTFGKVNNLSYLLDIASLQYQVNNSSYSLFQKCQCKRQRIHVFL